MICCGDQVNAECAVICPSESDMDRKPLEESGGWHEWDWVARGRYCSGTLGLPNGTGPLVSWYIIQPNRVLGAGFLLFSRLLFEPIGRCHEDSGFVCRVEFGLAGTVGSVGFLVSSGFTPPSLGPFRHPGIRLFGHDRVPSRVGHQGSPVRRNSLLCRR